ncbi:MAG: hypothetical protein IKP68_07340 [Clostridia bacterium]|nr:hypothetical protein [Clostridia bacterium]
MKKLISVILTVIVLAALCSAHAFAADETAVGTSASVEITEIFEPTKPSDLYSAANRAGVDVIDEWETNGYPDDIGAAIYAVSMSGYDPNKPDVKPEETIKYYIYVVKGATEERKAEIEAMMGGENVELRECSISKNTLDEYVSAIGNALGDKAYQVSATADQYDVRIALYYPEENDAEIRKMIARDFSSAESLVIFRSGVNPGDLDGDLETIGVIAAPGAESGASMLWLVLLPAVLIIAVGAFAVYRVHEKRLALSNGETVETTSAPTKSDVVKKVSSADVTPSDKVYENIIDKM